MEEVKVRANQYTSHEANLEKVHLKVFNDGKGGKGFVSKNCLFLDLEGDLLQGGEDVG